MHSANCLTGCTGTTALPTTEEHRSPAMDGNARSALRVLSKGISSVSTFGFRLRGAVSQKPLAIWPGDINSRMPGFCRGGSRTARMYTRRHKEDTAKANVRYDAKPRGGSGRSISRPHGGGLGGFAASIHSAMSCGLSSSVRRAQALVSSPEAIRGKTGPVPNEAVLFGPFSCE